MYKYEDYKDKIDLGQFTEVIIHAQNCFVDSWRGKVLLEELVRANGCDIWMKMACVDKLVELGYIAVVEKHEISQYTTYRNVRL